MYFSFQYPETLFCTLYRPSNRLLSRFNICLNFVTSTFCHSRLVYESQPLFSSSITRLFSKNFFTICEFFQSWHEYINFVNIRSIINVISIVHFLSKGSIILKLFDKKRKHICCIHYSFVNNRYFLLRTHNCIN